jgi:hypothetical protein
MALGDRTGRVHEQQQGTGLATVFDVGGYLDSLAAAKAAKAAQRSAAMKKFEEFDPEYWYIYDSQIQGEVEKLWDEGATLMQSGVANPWTSSDPNSMKFQQRAKRLEAYARGTKQMQSEFDKLRKFYDDPAQQKLISNWDEVAEYFYTDDIFTRLDQGEQVPQLRFNDPVVDSYKTTNSIISTWKERFPEQEMTSEEALKLAKDVFSNDAYKEGAGGGYIGMLSQAYGDLDPDVRKRIKAEADAEGVSPQEMYASSYFKSRMSTEPVNLLEEMWVSADKVKKDKFTVTKESVGGVTKKTMRDRVKEQEKKAMDIARSYVNMYPGQVEKDVKSGLYGDPTDTIKENIQAAIEYYTPKVEDRFTETREDALTRDGGSTYGGVDPVENANLWYSNLVSGEEAAMQNASRYLSGVEMPDGTKVEFAGTSEAGIMVMKLTGTRKMIEKWAPYEIPEIAEGETDIALRMRESASSSTRQYEGRGEEKIEYEVRINVYDKNQEEYLKNMHNQALKNRKSPFSRDYRTDRPQSKGGADLLEID